MSSEMPGEDQNPLKNKILFKQFNFCFKGLSQELEAAYLEIVEELGANSLLTAETYILVSSDHIGELHEVLYDIRFVRDCVMQEKLLDIEKYRFPSKEIESFMRKYTLRVKCSIDHNLKAWDQAKGFVGDSPENHRSFNKRRKSFVTCESGSVDLSAVEISPPKPYSASSLFHRDIKGESNSSNMDVSLLNINSLSTPHIFIDKPVSPVLSVSPLDISVLYDSPIEKFHTCLEESQNTCSGEQKTSSSSGSVVENTPQRVPLNNTRLNLMNLNSRSNPLKGTNVESTCINRTKVPKFSLSLKKKNYISDDISVCKNFEKENEELNAKTPDIPSVQDAAEENKSVSPLSPLVLKNWKKLPKLKQLEPSTSNGYKKILKNEPVMSGENSPKKMKMSEVSEKIRSGEFMCMEYLTGKRPKCTIRNCEFAIVPHDAHGSRERNMSSDEHMLMLKYIVNTKQIKFCKGNKVYESMHKEGFLTQRSVSTLQNSIRKSVLKNIDKFKLPLSIKQQFMDLN